MDLATHYLDTARFELRRLKKLAEDAVEQLDDEDLHRGIDEGDPPGFFGAPLAGGWQIGTVCPNVLGRIGRYFSG